MNNQKENLITLEEASKMTPYTADYLGQLIRKEKLEAWKEKGKWLTSREAVERYLQKVAEASYEHQKKLIDKIPAARRRRRMLFNLKWVLASFFVIVAAGALYGSYVFIDSKKNGVCAPYEVTQDKNGNEVIRVGNKEYVSNVLAAAKTSLAKLEY